MEPLVFPDGKALMIAWAKETTGLPVSSVVPDPRPDEFVTVQDAGSVRVNRLLREVNYTLGFWAKTTVRAYGLGSLVLAHFEIAESMSGVPIFKPRDWGPPVELPDESGHPRYTATVSFRMKGSPHLGAFFMPNFNS